MDTDMLKELLKEIPTMTEAIRLCIRQSRVTEKQIYLELDIGSSQWSRIMNGQLFFPQDKLLDLCRICGNDIPFQWGAIKFAAQDHEELERLREENKQLKVANENWERLLVQKITDKRSDS